MVRSKPDGLTRITFPTSDPLRASGLGAVSQRAFKYFLTSFIQELLEYYLYARDDFVEIIIAEERMGLAEIRPGVDVIHHQLDVVAVDVVIQAAGDRLDSVVPFLPRIQILPLDRSLKFLRDQKVSPFHIVAVGREIGEARRHTVHRATIDIFLQIFTDQIEWPQLQPCVHAPGRSFVCSG